MASDPASAPVLLDARGLVCPMPVLRTRDRLRDLVPGALLVVVADDPAVLQDLPDWCRAHGHHVLGHREGPAGTFHVTVRRGEARRAQARALGLVSGGLDSTLAARLLQEQGVEVEGVHFSTGFCTVDHRRALRRPSDLARSARVRDEALRAGADLEAPVEVVDVAEEYFREVVVSPRHGYGAAMNPCIDCRIFMLRKAGELARARGADVVFTGEVVGQRPMSQHHAALRLIEEESGLTGRLLRPLSAAHLPPTEAERDGRIDRARLGALAGRSRRDQLAMAQRFGIEVFPAPSGGCCFLADRSFGRRLRDLLEHRPAGSIGRRDLLLLKIGRHYRMAHDLKLVVGRDEAESRLLASMAAEGWSGQVADGHGTFGLVEGEPAGELAVQIAAVLARHSRSRDLQQVEVVLRRGDVEQRVWAAAAAPALLERLRV